MCLSQQAVVIISMWVEIVDYAKAWRNRKTYQMTSYWCEMDSGKTANI